MLGILLSIAAALCWGADAIFTRIALQRIKPSVGVTISMISSLALVGLLAFIIQFDSMVNLTVAALLWFGMVGFVNYAIGRQSNYLSIKHIGVARATPIFAASPLFAIIVAVIFTGERVNLLIVMGTLSILTGLILLITSRNE